MKGETVYFLDSSHLVFVNRSESETHVTACYMQRFIDRNRRDVGQSRATTEWFYFLNVSY